MIWWEMHGTRVWTNHRNVWKIMFDQLSAGQIIYIYIYIDLSRGHPNSWFRTEITLNSRLAIMVICPECSIHPDVWNHFPTLPHQRWPTNLAYIQSSCRTEMVPLNRATMVCLGHRNQWSDKMISCFIFGKFDDSLMRAFLCFWD